MAVARALVAPMSVARLAAPISASRLVPACTSRAVPLTYTTVRCATTSKTPPAKKKKVRNVFRQYDVRQTQQFALVDAMHYIRAFEVGHVHDTSKYELHVRLRTLRNGPALRNRLRMPHPVKTDLRVCVIAAPGSKAAQEARAVGAALVGEDEVFAQIQAGNIDFERCICHIDSLQKLNKSGVARLLGPKGLMPSAKAGTVVASVGPLVKSMISGSEYREKLAVVRMAVGQLAFTPAELQDNIRAFMDAVKKDIMQLQGRVSKEIHEVVLSSTHSPGFTLTGEFKTPDSISPALLTGPL